MRVTERSEVKRVIAPKLLLNYSFVQGYALVAPGHLRQLTFGPR